MFPKVALTQVPIAKEAFFGHKFSCQDLAGGIIHKHQQCGFGSTIFQPGMFRTVYLHQFATMLPSGTSVMGLSLLLTFAFQTPASIIIFRSVSLLKRIPFICSIFSAIRVGPKPFSSGSLIKLSTTSRIAASILRLLGTPRFLDTNPATPSTDIFAVSAEIVVH